MAQRQPTKAIKQTDNKQKQQVLWKGGFDFQELLHDQIQMSSLQQQQQIHKTFKETGKYGPFKGKNKSRESISEKEQMTNQSRKSSLKQLS